MQAVEERIVEFERQVNPRMCWNAQELQADSGWIYHLQDEHRQELVRAVRQAYQEGKDLLEYEAQEFDIERTKAFLQTGPLAQIRDGRGIALVKGLPRAEVTQKEFELLTWALGLHTGVARPQGKASQYMSQVRNAGMTYRTGTGRGYNSNAQLDYHTDSSDVLFLTCYNRAKSGGMSLVSSSMRALQEMYRRHPEYVQHLFEPIAFSRQGELAPGEGPYVLQPVFSECNGVWFGRWNWNRVKHAMEIEGAPRLTPRQLEALKLFDDVVRSPELSYHMWLEPGDMQVLNSHVTLHSRTEFEDYEEEERKRLLYRLWLAPPDSHELPQCWQALYGNCEAGSVRGGIKGLEYDERRRAFERRQAQYLGMKV